MKLPMLSIAPIVLFLGVTMLCAQSSANEGEVPLRLFESSRFPVLSLASSHSNFSFVVGNQFFIREMTTEEFVAKVRHKPHLFLLSCRHEGWSKFGELRSQVGYGLQVTPHLAFALQFIYLLHHARNYSSLHSITFDFSLWAKVNAKSGILLYAYNSAYLHYGIVGKSPIPVELKTMFYYHIHKDFSLCAQFCKMIPGGFDFELSGLLALRSIVFRGAFSLRSISLECSLRWNKFRFAFATYFDYRVGFSQRTACHYFYIR